MRFSFVVLHYLTNQDTEECIDSILKNVVYDDYFIIVVDNGSPNDSVKILSEIYKENNKVKFITNKQNLGFAKGNNIGYNFAKNKLNSDFIILLNNDTIIKQPTFISTIIKKYEEYNFDVLGPDIVSTQDGLHQNPRLKSTISEMEINTIVKQLKRKYYLNLLGIEAIVVYIYRLIKSFYSTKTESRIYNKNNESYKQQLENTSLHGACFIFSPKYVKRYNGLYSNTFMYMEEDILFYIAKKENLNLLYSPDIQIFHKEDSSTDATFKKDSKKRRFFYKHKIESAQEFLNILQDNSIYIEDIKSENLTKKIKGNK
ncbi:glycosyltransferase [Bacillus sp. PK3-056]|uniref:glycosyltransferase family 2 protein n=1 Tax=Niallia circulans TaxID=1397 RepID=UPI0013DE13B3|nr:glycosyltransferase [Niallia circulans]